MNRTLKTTLRRVPGLRRLVRESSVPAGHYYSPIPSLDEVRADDARVFAKDARTLPGIALDEPGQLALLSAIEAFCRDQPFGERPQDGLRYHFDNPYFRHADGLVLYGMLRHFAPKRVVEVGSGFSSALMLDVNDRHFGGALACTFIDPHPERLQSLLRDADRTRTRVEPRRVQDVPLEVFTALEAGDLLFIDSSHVAKTGSDVNDLFFRVLPALRDGVVIHVHDVCWPFEYPRGWVLDLERAWNEAYLLRAFLQYNARFEVLFFNDFVAQFHADRLADRLPLFLRSPGQSVWLRSKKG